MIGTQVYRYQLVFGPTSTYVVAVPTVPCASIYSSIQRSILFFVFTSNFYRERRDIEAAPAPSLFPIRYSYNDKTVSSNLVRLILFFVSTSQRRLINDGDLVTLSPARPITYSISAPISSIYRTGRLRVGEKHQEHPHQKHRRRLPWSDLLVAAWIRHFVRRVQRYVTPCMFFASLFSDDTCIYCCIFRCHHCCFSGLPAS